MALSPSLLDAFRKKVEAEMPAMRRQIEDDFIRDDLPRLLAKAMLERDFSTLHACADCYKVEAGHVANRISRLRSERGEDGE